MNQQAARIAKKSWAANAAPAALVRSPQVRAILRPPAVQPKLKLGAVDDPAEAEADRVADQVMRMPEPAAGGAGLAASGSTGTPIRRLCADCESELQRMPADDRVRRMEEDEDEVQLKRAPETIQRLCPHCAAEGLDSESASGDETVRRQSEDDDEEIVQTKQAPGNGPQLSPASESLISSLRGGGAPLPASERAFFEPRLGRDLGAVRIHDGPTAADTARSINARAFTLGGDVVFARGEYRPASRDGLRLLAHELTHTAQQGASPARAASPVAAGSAPPGTVQREIDCTTAAPRFSCPTSPENRQAVVEERREWALRKVAHAAAVLESLDPESLNPRAEPAFEAFFGPFEPARITDVATRLRRIESSMVAFQQPGVGGSAAPFPLNCANECEPSCGGHPAFFDPSDHSIQFCDGFFKKGETGQKSTFVHEMVHATLGSGDAEIYSSRRLFARLPEEPSDDPNASSLAAQNPDSFAAFVLAVAGLPLAEAQTLKGELPTDRYSGFRDPAEEDQARRAVAYAEMVVRTARDDVDDLRAALDLMPTTETWSAAVQRLGIGYERDTLHLLRGTPIDASADRNTTCRAPSRFSISCPENGRTRQDGDLSTVRRIGEQIGRVEKLFTNSNRLLVRRGARGLRGGEEADFRFRAFLQRDRLRLSDAFFSLTPNTQALAIVEEVVRGLDLPTPSNYLIFLRRTTQRSELRDLPVF